MNRKMPLLYEGTSEAKVQARVRHCVPETSLCCTCLRRHILHNICLEVGGFAHFCDTQEHCVRLQGIV